jgi:hypothetical protein
MLEAAQVEAMRVSNERRRDKNTRKNCSNRTSEKRDLLHLFYLLF